LAYIKGWLIAVEMKVGHPVAVGREWVGERRKEWRRKVVKCSSRNEIKSAVVELERVLSAQGTILVDDSTTTTTTLRRGTSSTTSFRSKWRHYLSDATTMPQLMVVIRAFHSLIDWSALEKAKKSQPRQRWIDLLPRHHRITPPEEDDVVIFYRQG